MQYLVGLILPILSYFLQIYPRVINRYFGVDVWTILVETKLVKENNHRIPLEKIRQGFIIDGYFDYPPIFLILLSFFSTKTLLKIQGFISPFFDALQNFLVFLLALSITQNTAVALLAQLIYSLVPVSALENSSLLPRSLGYLLFTLSFYFMINYSASNIYLLAGIFFTAVTLLTHKFATQSLFFISIFFCVLEKSPFYLVIFFSGMVLAVFFSKGYYLRVLKSHLSLIFFWFKNYKNRFIHQIYGDLPPIKHPDLISIIYKLISKMAPLTLLISNVWILSAFLFLFFTKSSNLLLNKMAVWVIFFYLFGVIVSMTKRLTPIGEGYRYLEMTTVPSAIITSILFMDFYNSSLKIYAVIVLVSLLLLSLFTIIFIQIKAVVKDKNRSLTKNMREVFSFINKLPGKPRIMCVPHQITTMVVYNTKADVLVNFDTAGFFQMQGFFPLLKTPISELIKKYQLNYLILRTSYVKIEELKIKNPQIVFHADDVALIKLIA